MAEGSTPGDRERRPSRLPPFITDLWREPKARDALLASYLAIAAYGLDPHAFAAGTPTVQSALRDRPELETLLLLAAVLGAGILLIGGALGDILRSRRLLVAGLAGQAGVTGGLPAGVLVGRRDPLATVWEHGDERPPAGARDVAAVSSLDATPNP